ncbi:hypothetical protein Patl1_37190 [Pistacia atlantica]|nr:hypothetical protein Patl1_37190 [Pistacia atlantica]
MSIDLSSFDRLDVWRVSHSGVLGRPSSISCLSLNRLGIREIRAINSRRKALVLTALWKRRKRVIPLTPMARQVLAGSSLVPARVNLVEAIGQLADHLRIPMRAFTTSISMESWAILWGLPPVALLQKVACDQT